MDLDKQNTKQVEIWGGAEYTVVRVKNGTYDQLARSGHEERTEDLNLFSDLNISTIRYPLLWEKYAANESLFFETNDSRLDKLKDLEIVPIAGLLHHGSGPFFTDMLDPDFPEYLAEYACTIARRYPFIKKYTPVNEPLTTARFSGLYGIWYPHKKDDRFFIRMLVNELKGIVLSMKAVRSINPSAELIQTEDICKIQSTPELSYQAVFENHRRWLTYDILLGKLIPGHPLWKYFTDAGIKESELQFFTDNPLTPAICGFNYYVTSDRYLDQRKYIYPSWYHGSNGLHDYADVEAVRANINVEINLKALLREAWERYHLPIALTEVHLACTREEQLRWFMEAYESGMMLKSEGIDFRAITAWSFFGSFDWNSLMCSPDNYYESGVYDIRSGIPRATALAGMIKSINSKGTYRSSLIQVPGWWRRKDRFIYKPENEASFLKEDKEDHAGISPLLIIGAKGSLGSAFARICTSRGIIHSLSDRSQVDIASIESVRNILEKLKPWCVINAAGFTRIDEAENASSTCFRENTTGAVVLAEACRSLGIKFVTFSSDQVFNGKKRKPYTEYDSTQPLNLYGLSKLHAEENVLKIYPESLIIRSSSFFNPWHSDDILRKILHSENSSGRHHHLASDIVFSPTYIPDLVNTVLDLMIDNETGIWHLSNQEEVSHFEFARMALNLAGYNGDTISSVPSSSLKYAAMRPKYSVLKSSSGITLPSLTISLRSYLDEFEKVPSFQILNQSII